MARKADVAALEVAIGYAFADATRTGTTSGWSFLGIGCWD